jgi:SAM-dependent methyltransferase
MRTRILIVSYSPNAPERRLNGRFTTGSGSVLYRFVMFKFTSYEFNYHWAVGYGLAIPLVLAAAVGAMALWRGWPRWVSILAAIVMVWAVAGIFIVNVVWGINRPMTLPTDRFLASGTGHVLDAGAGSGRAAVGVLLARPQARVTGLDIYSGFWGIDDNTPQRFMTNARIAGAADRADARTGDLRKTLPFDDAAFDAVVSSYAIDHLRREGRANAIAEVARVLKPRGEFLLMIVNVDWPALVFSPHAMGHHPRQDPADWRDLLERAGFALEEEGTQPATRYFYARKQAK